MDKFAGVCQSVLHDCKLTFLQIICDHDLFVEMPGRDPSDRYVNKSDRISLLIAQHKLVFFPSERSLYRLDIFRID